MKNINESLLTAAMLMVPFAGYGAVPITFESNRGQAPVGVEFLAHGDGYGLSLSAGEAALTVDGGGFRMRIAGGARRARAVPDSDSKATVNYLVGKDPRAWRRDIPSYGRIKYENVYRGIDVISYARLRQLEYDFVVKPGARPEAIGLRFDGARKVLIDDSGNLLVYLAGVAEPVRFHKPEIYQENERVEGGYVLQGSRAGFRVSNYDHTKPLVIDPAISYSTYLGGSGNDVAQGVALDAQGNTYVTGYTTSTDFPVTSEGIGAKADGTHNKVFVAKVNAAGNKLIYSTYLGGSNDDFARGIAADTAENVYIAGNTLSADFPAVNAAQSKFAGGTGSGDGFVAS